MSSIIFEKGIWSYIQELFENFRIVHVSNGINISVMFVYVYPSYKVKSLSLVFTISDSFAFGIFNSLLA